MGNCLTMFKTKAKAAVDTNNDGTISAEEAAAAGQKIVEAGKQGAELLGQIGLEVPGVAADKDEHKKKKHKKR